MKNFRTPTLCWLLAAVSPTFAVTPDTQDFAFIHFSDIHVSPYVARFGKPPALRGAEGIAWLCEEAIGPQSIPGLQHTSATPAFALATGDLTEFGVIDATWAEFEKAFATLPYPLYVLPGNHDNTWVAMLDVMRAKYGGENYSFDQAGCHFICLNSATPQEPVPTLDGKTRAFLRQDLAKTPHDTPVFVAMHHPPYGGEFANPAEHDTLIDLLRDWNVVLVLYGHGHTASHRVMDGLDGVMGGTTFKRNTGYAVASVQDGTLRYAYRYLNPPEGVKTDTDGWRMLLEKPIARSAPRRLFTLEAPPELTAIGTSLEVALVPTANIALEDVTARVDGEEVQVTAAPDTSGYRVAIGERTPGWHLLSVRASDGVGQSDLRTAEFRVPAPKPRQHWRVTLPAAVKAAPVVIDDKLIIAGTDGLVRALDRHTSAALWTFATGAEILGAPAWSGELLVLGAGDGGVYALDADGENHWRYAADFPVYGWPLIDGEVVYVGDNSGRLHAINLADGTRRWLFERADFAIEAQPCIFGEQVVVGAWDGHVYAVNRADGTLAWKSLGPKASEGSGITYYGPADCGPVAIGERLLVCDRGYCLGAYDRTGQLVERLGEGVAAITRTDRGLLCRTLSSGVQLLRANGKSAWTADVPAGRFPIPPTLRGDAVYVCSNQGLLSVLAAQTGQPRWRYQTTAGFFVMAPVAVADDGICYVAGMDGSVLALE